MLLAAETMLSSGIVVHTTYTVVTRFETYRVGVSSIWETRQCGGESHDCTRTYGDLPMALKTRVVKVEVLLCKLKKSVAFALAPTRPDV